MNWRPIWNGERVCATNGIQWRRHDHRRTNEATRAWRKPHGPQSNCRRPSVHQQNARQKTPDHAHDANNHTMNTTATCNPQGLRQHAFTWKPSTTGGHPTQTKQPICYNSSSAAQKTRTRKHIWSTTPHIKSNFLCLGDTSLLPMKYARCPRHIARATCDTCGKQKDSGNTSPKTSFHHFTRAPQQGVSELVLHVQSWPRAARRKTQGTRNRRHELCSRAPHTKHHGTSSGETTVVIRPQHGLPCDFLHDLGRCQRTCVLCSNAPPW